MDEDNSPAPIDENADRTTRVVDAARDQLEREAKRFHWWMTAIAMVLATGFGAAVYLSTLAPKTALEAAVAEMNGKMDKVVRRIDDHEARLFAIEKAAAIERTHRRTIEKALRWQTRATYETLAPRVKEHVLPPPPVDIEDE